MLKEDLDRDYHVETKKQRPDLSRPPDELEANQSWVLRFASPLFFSASLVLVNLA